MDYPCLDLLGFLNPLSHGKQILNGPTVVRDASGYCWGHFQRLVRTDKVVDHEVSWFSIFLEKAFVSRVNRHIRIRMVKFWRSA